MLLTEQEIEDVAIFVMNADTFDIKRLGHDFARSIEAKVIEKIKARRVGHWNGDCTFPVFLTSVKGTAYCNVPLYRLPEGD